MKSFLTCLILLCSTCVACSNDPVKPDVETPSNETMIVSSYIRGNFFYRQRISTASMQACNDLIVIGATPNADGSLNLDRFEAGNNGETASFQTLVEAVRAAVPNSDTKIRLGVASGSHWKTMVADPTAYNRFAIAVLNLVQELNLDGVDLDFEWANTPAEFENYSQALVAIRSTLGADYRLTAAIHPLYYQWTNEAMQAVDYAFLQCYGPSPVRFSYEQYVSDLQKVLNYGFSANGVVAGVPFYGVTADDSHQTVAYYTLVTDGIVSSASQNEVVFEGQNYVFNGQDLSKKKTAYAQSIQLAGMMSWDLATDVPFTNSLSLLKAMTEAISE